MQTFALIIAIIFFAAGLLGSLLPVLPGPILIYAGLLLYGIMTGFAEVKATFFLVQALVLVLVFAIDFFASAAGTKRFNGSKYSAWGAVIGTIFGLVIFGPIGVIVGPFIGAVVAEFIYCKNVEKAVKVGFGTLVGFLGGTVLKLLAEILMIIYFFVVIL